MVRDCFNCGAIFSPSDTSPYLCSECYSINRDRQSETYQEEAIIERLTKRMNIMEELLTLVLSGSTDLDKIKELSVRYKDIV